jgi:hypothetical protein
MTLPPFGEVGVVGQLGKHILAAAKAAIDFEAFMARVKPSPFPVVVDRPALGGVAIEALGLKPSCLVWVPYAALKLKYRSSTRDSGGCRLR